MNSWTNLNPSSNSQSKLKKFWPIIMLVVLLIAIPLGIYLVRQAQIFKPKADSQTVGMKLEYSDGSQIIKVGNTFKIDILVNSGENLINVFNAKLKFDPNKLKVLNIDTATSSAFLQAPTPCGGSLSLQCAQGYYCKQGTCKQLPNGGSIDGTKAENEICEDASECKPGLVCKSGCLPESPNCQAQLPLCQQPSLGEGERCDIGHGDCAGDMECRPICEQQSASAPTCDAVGSICKKPRSKIEHNFNNQEGSIDIYATSQNGVSPEQLILATIVFQAANTPGITTISFVDGSGLIAGNTNVMQLKGNLDVDIKPANFGDPPPGKGDGNGDGVIDLADLSVMFSNFFKDMPKLDFNDDGIINSLDYAYMKQVLINRGVIRVSNTTSPAPSTTTSCAQVITRACKYENVQCVTAPCPPVRTCQDFPTPCDVPEGWLTRTACIPRKNGELQGKQYSPNTINIGFNTNVTEQQAQALIASRQLTATVIGGNFNALRAMTVNIPANEVAKWICDFEYEDIVKYAEPNLTAQAN